MSTSLKSADHSILQALITLLSEERLAIASFDATSLRRLAEKKLETIAQLRASLKDNPGACQTEDVSLVLCEARANQALLRDALHTLSECLGVQPSSVYNQRAKFSALSSAQTVHHSA